MIILPMVRHDKTMIKRYTKKDPCPASERRCRAGNRVGHYTTRDNAEADEVHQLVVLDAVYKKRRGSLTP